MNKILTTFKSITLEQLDLLLTQKENLDKEKLLKNQSDKIDSFFSQNNISDSLLFSFNLSNKFFNERLNIAQERFNSLDTELDELSLSLLEEDSRIIFLQKFEKILKKYLGTRIQDDGEELEEAIINTLSIFYNDIPY